MGLLAGRTGWPQDIATIHIDRALKTSSLTDEGVPFHVVLEIGTTGAAYSGQVEVWWLSATKYHVVVSSPNFSQVKTVNGDKVEENDTGDYEPRWLEDFVFAVLDPGSLVQSFVGNELIFPGAHGSPSCLRHDDRPGGVTNQLTWGVLCFGDPATRITSILTFNHAMTFADWKKFAGKQVARTYETSVLAFQPVVGHITRLEELKQPDEGMFQVAVVTPVDQRIETAFVSTSQEEGLLDHAPAITWPAVREGKTEGYMILYARTDRTGQVRETAKHNSDQPGLEDFAMKQALGFKFKPLLVNGVAEQMEMPLVLHFATRLEDPLPILSVDRMRKQMVSCNAGKVAGTQTVRMRVSVDETGKMAGMSATTPLNGQTFLAADRQLHGCTFAPLVVNGKVTYYKGDVDVAVP